MKAVCPNNSEHNLFRTVHHIAEDALFAGDGMWVGPVDNPEAQAVHGPNAGNIWNCEICGAEAEVTE